MTMRPRSGIPGTGIRRAAVLPILVLTISTLFPIQPVRASSSFDLAAYEGKVVLLDFWASWCKPCRRSFPWMNAMQEKYGDDGLVIVAVNVDNDPAAAQRFLAEHPARFQLLYDAEKSIVREYEVVAMPSSFLIGRDGQLVEQHLGFKVVQQTQYEAAIRAALHQEQF